MPKFLIIAGVLLLFAGTLASVILPVLGAFDIARQATNTNERAQAFCREGETLSKSEGPTTYTPGQGYAAVVTYTCTNAAGVRRDVSNEVGGDILDDSLDSAKGLGARLAIGIGTIMLGGLTLTAGIILGIKRMMPRFSSAGKQAAVSFQDFHLGQAAPSTPATPPSPEVIAATPPAGTDDALSHRLRALQVARDANLLSAEEFERLRAEALQ